MKTKLIILPLAIAALAVNVNAADKPSLETQQGKAGYTIGMNIGAGLKQDGVDINIDALVAGVKDSFTGATAQLTPEQQQEAMTVLQKEITAKIVAEPRTRQTRA